MVPSIRGCVPGEQSRVVHERCTNHFSGLSDHTRMFPVAFESGEGCVLTDVDGNRYLDFSSGICAASLGHGHPKVAQAISRQTRQLSNCHDFSTRVKAELVETLSSLLPKELNCFQFYDSGATAVEAALRLVRAATRRPELLSCENDFHGRTLATSQLSGKSDGLPGQHFLPWPNLYRPLWTSKAGEIDTAAYLQHYEEYLEQSPPDTIAGIIVEPIQGWAGAIMPPDDFFPKLRQFCNQRELLLVADEVLTGWGRTGEWLCLDRWGVTPDIAVLGKSLGNGFPVSCLAVHEKYRKVLDGLKASTSTGGNPVACAAALAVTQSLEQESLLACARHLGKVALERMEKMKEQHAIVGDVRAVGCLMGIEFVKDRKSKEPDLEAGHGVYRLASSRGVALVPAGHILRLSPPIVMDERALLRGLDLIDEAIGEVASRLGD